MIIYAILKINPDAKVTVVGNDIDTCELKWHDGTTPISKDEIKKILSDVTDEQTVLQNRRNEYPVIEDQLDDIYHNGIDGWKATIKAVKDKYPKE
tara:strand:- start:85 stop:369 length:285 start_codon:yes stop_codon:yes gene_type:complete